MKVHLDRVCLEYHKTQSRKVIRNNYCVLKDIRTPFASKMQFVVVVLVAALGVVSVLSAPTTPIADLPPCPWGHLPKSGPVCKLDEKEYTEDQQLCICPSNTMCIDIVGDIVKCGMNVIHENWLDRTDGLYRPDPGAKHQNNL